MAVKRTNLSIPAGLYDRAQEVMASRHYDSFSEYVAELIRRDALANSRGADSSRLNEGGGEYGGPPKKARNAIAPASRTDYFVVTREG